MSEMGKWFPSGVVEWISFPLNQVLDVPVVTALVKDLLYLILRFLRVPDLDRKWWWLDPALEVFWRLVISLEKRDVKDRVDAHGVGQLKAIGCV